MANFRTTADLLDLALTNAGEVTNGNSSYEAQLLNYLNRVHYALIAGGTIPLTKDLSITIDEVWPWSKAKNPLIIELQPKIDTGTVTVTVGSEGITFSSGPAVSVAGWHFRIKGRDEWFKIASHTAASTSADLDAAYTGATGSGLTFELMKLDYKLVPDYIVINTDNNKLQFQETAGTTLTATLTAGTYTPAQLATEVQTQLNTAGGTPVYTVTYSAITRKFTIASDRGGGAVFVLVGTGDQSLFSAHKTLGFDDENSTNAASVTSTYILGGISRLVEPFKMAKGTTLDGSVYGVDAETFQRDFPYPLIDEGNPTMFCVIREDDDGTFTVRFNKFPDAKTRVEVEHVPVPRDLKDSSASIPLVPRKHNDVLEDAATFYLLLNKNDDRAQFHMNMLQAKLTAMISQHRGALLRAGRNFGKIIARPDLMKQSRRKLVYGGNQ